jgi:hypothetical protein
VRDWPWQYIIPTLTALVATGVWGAEYDWSFPQPLAIWIGTWVYMAAEYILDQLKEDD